MDTPGETVDQVSGATRAEDLVSGDSAGARDMEGRVLADQVVTPAEDIPQASRLEDTREDKV